MCNLAAAVAGVGLLMLMGRNRKQKEQLLRSLEDAVPLVPEPRATSVDIVTGFSARCASVAAPCFTNADAGYASVRTIARSLYRPRTVA